MTPLVWKLTIDSTDAVRQVKAFGVEAAEISRAAPPVTLKMDASSVLRSQQQIEAAAVKAASATEKAAAREEAAWQRASQQAMAAADKQAAAQLKLSSMAAGTAGEKASSDFAAKEAEIKRLLALTGDQATADRALKLAQQDVARSLVQGGAAAEVAARGSGKAGAAVGMLGMQLSDVASQLTTGTNPFTILIQQGPQVAYAVQQGGGATAIFAESMGWLSTAATTAAAALPPVALGVTVLVGAYSSYANATMTAQSQADALNEAIYQQGLTAGTTEQDIKNLSAAWDTFTGAMQEAQTYVATVNGDLEEWEVKAGKMARSVIDGSKGQIKAEADHIASLKQQKDAVQALIDSEGTSASQLPDLFKRRRELTAEIAAAVPVLEEHKQAVDETVAAVTEAARKENEEAGAKRAQTKAHKEHTEALRDEAEWSRLLNAAMADENAKAKLYASAVHGMQAVGEAAQDRLAREKTASEQIIDDYNAQIQKIRELEATAEHLSTSESEIANARIASHKAAAQAEEAMLARLSDMREKAALDGLAMQNTVAEKQAAIVAKGIEDARDLGNQYRAAASDVAKSIGQIFTTVLDRITSTETQAYQTAAATVKDLDGMIADLSDTVIDASKLSGDALEKAYKDGEVSAKDLTDAQKKQLETRLKAEEKAAKAEAEGHKKAAMVAWEISQGTAAATAAINTLLAISSANTLPYPANLVAIGVAAAAGVAEEVAIAASPPPSFRGGGVVSDTAPMVAPASSLPDVRLISAEVGESVNTRRGTQNLGGEEGVRRNNAGVPIEPPKFVLMWNHEVLDRGVSTLMKRPSTTRAMLSRHTTRTNPYLVRR